MTIACDAASLRKLPIFSKLDDKKLRLVAMMAERLNYHPGDYIAREGDTPEAVFIVLSGEVILSRSTPCGQLQALTLSNGSLFGDVPILCGGTYLGNATAQTDVAILRLDKDLFFELLRTVPDFAIAVCRDLAGRVYHLIERMIQSDTRA